MSESKANRIVKRHSGAKISYFSDKVVKHQGVDQTWLEVKKTEEAILISKKTCLFRVPRVYSYNLEEGSIIFERLIGMLPIYKFMRNPCVSKAVAVRLGEILAAIHEHVPQHWKMHSGSYSREYGDIPPVFTHGDFAINNIFYHPKTDQIAIIDWSPAPWLTDRAQIDTHYADLCVFLFSLFVRSPLRPWEIRYPESVAQAMIRTYNAKTSTAVNSVNLKRYCEKVLSETREPRKSLRSTLRMLMLRRSMARMKRFIGVPNLLE